MFTLENIVAAMREQGCARGTIMGVVDTLTRIELDQKIDTLRCKRENRRNDVRADLYKSNGSDEHELLELTGL